MSDLSFKKENSALIIIDMQNAFIHKEGSLSKMGLDASRTSNPIEPIRKLKKAFKEVKLPVIYLQHTHRRDRTDAGLIEKVFPPIMDLGHCFNDTWDAEIISELKPDADDYIVKNIVLVDFIIHSLKMFYAV